MPVYAGVTNPYVFSLEEKQRIKNLSPEAIRALTERAMDHGYDGGILEFGDGSIELVVFKNTAVKSATGNTGAFDGRDPDIRHSFAGRNAQGANLHALDGAKQRIAAGEDPEAVRRNTGWHRGVDGLWRFEISDRQAAAPGATAGEVIDMAHVNALAEGRQAPTFSGGRAEWRSARKLAMCCLMSGPCAIRRGTAG